MPPVRSASCQSNWDPATYDGARRRLVPCFDAFYGTVVELVARTAPARHPRVLDLGAGTGLLSAQLLARVAPASLTLLDGAAGMLEQARRRLATHSATLIEGDFTQPLPAGPFDGVVSALAIHHLDDTEKRALFARIHGALAPGGLFVNAEQIAGVDALEQGLFEQLHLDGARRLGSSEAEIAGAVERMKIDRCAPLDAQLRWLADAGFQRCGVYFQWFRFAVYAGWKAPGPALLAN
ncbi:MAG TPA: class I SAM-dependent methyltransferase [Acidobacteriota bacterium]|nr:class I SAM-dependent methyltransferase [Acidobacteriota bacterium]